MTIEHEPAIEALPNSEQSQRLIDDVLAELMPRIDSLQSMRPEEIFKTILNCYGRKNPKDPYQEVSVETLEQITHTLFPNRLRLDPQEVLFPSPSSNINMFPPKFSSPHTRLVTSPFVYNGVEIRANQEKPEHTTIKLLDPSDETPMTKIIHTCMALPEEKEEISPEALVLQLIASYGKKTEQDPCQPIPLDELLKIVQQVFPKKSSNLSVLIDFLVNQTEIKKDKDPGKTTIQMLNR